MADRPSPLDNLVALLRDPIDFFTRLAGEHGRDQALVPFSNGGPRPMFLVNDPEIVREVLVSREPEFGKWFHNTLSVEILGQGLVVGQGEPYRQMRRMVQPAFHRRHLPSHAREIVAIGLSERDRWPENAAFDLGPAVCRLTTRVIGRLLFGSDPAGTGVVERLVTAMQTLLTVFGRTTLPAAERTRYETALADFHAVLASLAADRRRETTLSPGDSREPPAGTAPPPDLLDLLLAARWEDGEALSAGELRDQMTTVFFAGQNTTAEALNWTFYLLATHPEAEAKILAEIDGLLGPPERGRPATFDDAARLVYTRQVWQEALRLYPPIWLLARQARQDLSLGGQTLPAGSVLFVSAYVSQRDGRFWPEPDRFRPERWAAADEVPAGPPRPPLCYFPFSTGPRRCMGEAIAETEGVLLLATILQRRRVRLAPQPPMEPQAVGFLLRTKRGLLVTAERR